MQLVCWEERVKLRITLAQQVETGVHDRILIGSGNAKLLLRLEDTRGRDTDIVVLPERGAYELLQNGIVKNIPSLLVAQGLGGRIAWRPRRRGAIGRRKIHFGSLIILAHRASGKQGRERDQQKRQFHLGGGSSHAGYFSGSPGPQGTKYEPGTGRRASRTPAFNPHPRRLEKTPDAGHPLPQAGEGKEYSAQFLRALMRNYLSGSP